MTDKDRETARGIVLRHYGPVMDGDAFRCEESITAALETARAEERERDPDFLEALAQDARTQGFTSIAEWLEGLATAIRKEGK